MERDQRNISPCKVIRCNNERAFGRHVIATDQAYARGGMKNYNRQPAYHLPQYGRCDVGYIEILYKLTRLHWWFLLVCSCAEMLLLFLFHIRPSPYR